MDRIHIHSRWLEESATTVIAAHGLLDTATSVELEKVLQRILKQRRFRLIVDLTAVTYISSAGWGIFLSELRRIRQQGGDLCLVGMRPEVFEVYELLEFRSVLAQYPTVPEAIAAFAPVESGAPADAGG